MGVAGNWCLSSRFSCCVSVRLSRTWSPAPVQSARYGRESVTQYYTVVNQVRPTSIAYSWSRVYYTKSIAKTPVVEKMKVVLARVCKVLLALLCLSSVLSSQAQVATYPVINDAKVIPANGQGNCPTNEEINDAQTIIGAEVQQIFFSSCSDVFQRNPNASAGFTGFSTRWATLCGSTAAQATICHSATALTGLTGLAGR